MWIDPDSDGCIYDTVDCDHSCHGCDFGIKECEYCKEEYSYDEEHECIEKIRGEEIMRMKTLGNRMKDNYENVTKVYLTRRMPVIIRIDGKAFHSFVKENNIKQPFDQELIESFNYTARRLASQIPGFKLAYLQSDEISILITDYDKIKTEAWFNYNLRKIVSVSASITTAYFNQYCGRLAMFDSRAFNVPKDEVANYFLWRMLDWERNSIRIYASQFFSHEQLHNKSLNEMHEMLYTIDKNWANDLKDYEKNGRLLMNTEKGLEFRSDVQPKFEEINNIVKDLI